MNNAPSVLCTGINAGMADKSQEERIRLGIDSNGRGADGSSRLPVDKGLCHGARKALMKWSHQERKTGGPNNYSNPHKSGSWHLLCDSADVVMQSPRDGMPFSRSRFTVTSFTGTPSLKYRIDH